MLQPSTTLNQLDLFTIKVLHASLLAITAAAMLVMVVVHGASFFNQAKLVLCRVGKSNEGGQYFSLQLNNSLSEYMPEVHSTSVYLTN